MSDNGSPGVTLRPVAPLDEDFLIDLYGTTRQAELDQVDWPPQAREAFIRSQYMAQDHHYRTQYQDADFNVIEIDGVAAGRLCIARWPDEIRVMDIALLPSCRGRGVGNSVLRTICSDAAATKRSVSVHVERLNPARRLYMRLGFVVIESGPVYELLVWRPDEEVS